MSVTLILRPVSNVSRMMHDVPLKMINKRIDDVLILVGLEKRKHDKVKTYSGGMRRRMEIPRGLQNMPK
jgi:ABC-2 type transport system ATP-binding protein